MSNQAGKGDARRPYDREKWDASPLWKSLEKLEIPEDNEEEKPEEDTP